jgi:hypothetical protein
MLGILFYFFLLFRKGNIIFVSSFVVGIVLSLLICYLVASAIPSCKRDNMNTTFYTQGYINKENMCVNDRGVANFGGGGSNPSPNERENNIAWRSHALHHNPFWAHFDTPSLMGNSRLHPVMMHSEGGHGTVMNDCYARSKTSQIFFFW